jgi:hypothetical protein
MKIQNITENEINVDCFVRDNQKIPTQGIINIRDGFKDTEEFTRLIVNKYIKVIEEPKAETKCSTKKSKK